MNKKNNQRTRLSKMLLKDALLDLLSETGSIEIISVRTLCERAELNRSTFYAHYTQPQDLLNEIEDELLENAALHLEKIGRANSMSAGEFLLSFLQFIRKNDKEFRILLVDAADADFRSKFMNIATGQIGDHFDFSISSGEEQYIYSYILNGSSAVVIQWIRSGYSVDEKQLVHLLYRMNEHLLKGVL